MGMAVCRRRPFPERNADGLLIRFELPYIALKSSLLLDRSGPDALGTYFHELCHHFGGDYSASFSRALSLMLDLVLTRHRLLEEFEKAWEQNSRES